MFITVGLLSHLSSSLFINTLEFSVQSLLTLIFGIIGIKYLVNNIIDLKFYKIFIAAVTIGGSYFLVPLLKAVKLINFPENYIVHISALGLCIIFILYIVLAAVTGKYTEKFFNLLFIPLILFFLLALVFRTSYGDSLSQIFTFAPIIIWILTPLSAIFLFKE